MPTPAEEPGPRFSGRLAWDTPRNSLTLAVLGRRAAGREIRDLTLSNPTRAGIPYPDEAIRAALSLPAVSVYDPSPQGLRAAREAVAEEYAVQGTPGVDPDRLWLTASTSEAYAFLLKLACDPGSRVLVPEPSYPLFAFLAGLEGVAVDAYPLGYDGRWTLDAGELAAAVGPHTKAVFLVHPNNPTGSFIRRDELASVFAVAEAHRLIVVSDEVFSPYAWGPDPRRAGVVAEAASEAGVLAFSLGGLSKSAGLPQVKLAWILAGGPETMVSAARVRLDLIADTYLSVGTPVQHAAKALTALGRTVAASIRTRLAENRALIAEALGPRPELQLLTADGGWYGTIRVPAVRTEEELCLALLSTAGVLVHPGHFFDFPNEAYLVVSLLSLSEDLRVGLDALAEVVRRA